jgi:hypothetical protein
MSSGTVAVFAAGKGAMAGVETPAGRLVPARHGETGVGGWIGLEETEGAGVGSSRFVTEGLGFTTGVEADGTAGAEAIDEVPVAGEPTAGAAPGE